jgi:hypothetical protein
MEKGDMVGKLAIWAFIGGVVLALLFGLYQASTLNTGSLINNFYATSTGGWAAWLLAIIGIIVGVLAVLGKGTITKQEVPGFLMAGVALLVMYGVFGSTTSTIYLSPWLGALLIGISESLAIFIAPAVGLLALKAAWDIGKNV